MSRRQALSALPGKAAWVFTDDSVRSRSCLRQAFATCAGLRPLRFVRRAAFCVLTLVFL